MFCYYKFRESNLEKLLKVNEEVKMNKIRRERVPYRKATNYQGIHAGRQNRGILGIEESPE